MNQNGILPSTQPKKRSSIKTLRRSEANSSSTNSSSGGQIVKKTPRVENRQYKKAWEELPELRGWITPCPGYPQRACCLYCRISLRAHRRDLVDHSMTERHIRNANEAANILAVDNNNLHNNAETVAAGIAALESSKVDANEFLQSQLFDFQGDHDDQMADESVINDASGSGVEEPMLDSSIADQRKSNMVALTRAVRQSQQQILVIQTGGTIDKDYPKTIRGYAFEIGEPAAQRVFERVGLELPVVFRTVCRKDSQEITTDDRYLIFDCCANAPQQRILITHGTDTLLETAAYLSEFSDLGTKIIVLTGSMKPETFRNSDADFNIGCALGALQSLAIAGIYVSMHGIVARWDLVERDASTNRFTKKGNAAYM